MFLFLQNCHWGTLKNKTKKHNEPFLQKILISFIIFHKAKKTRFAFFSPNLLPVNKYFLWIFMHSQVFAASCWQDREALFVYLKAFHGNEPGVYSLLRDWKFFLIKILIGDVIFTHHTSHKTTNGLFLKSFSHLVCYLPFTLNKVTLCSNSKCPHTLWKHQMLFL